MAGGELADWPVGGPGAHFKIFIPEMRTYTVRHYDPEARELTIDFVLDSDGPATRWARNAQPGDGFEVSGQARGGFAPEGDCVLIADPSAEPAVHAIVAALPDGARATTVVMLSAQLPDAVRDLDIPEGAPVWVGAEAGAMRTIRHHLLEERGLARERVTTRAYWRVGTANHPDHDTGEDEI